MGKGGYTGGSTIIHPGSSWFGKSSSQTAKKKKTKPVAPPVSSKPRKKKSERVEPPLEKRSLGLTRAEIVTKTLKRVHLLEREIATAKRRLSALERDLVRAQADAVAAQQLPPKSALGLALREAHSKAPPDQTAKPVVKEHEAKRHRNAPKEIDVEHRIAGKLIGTRKVIRS